MEQVAELNSQLLVIAHSHIVEAKAPLGRINSVLKNIVEHAFGHAQGVRDNLLGAALNKVDMNIFGRYARHRKNYYYNKQYARAGYT
jgi:hypothetical protein